MSSGLALVASAGLLYSIHAWAQNEGHEAGGTRMQMNMDSMQGGRSPAGARDPHAYSDGREFGPNRLELADSHRLASVLVDNFEAQRIDGDTVAAFDIEGWYGGTYNRGVLKSEGELDGGNVLGSRTELLWGHAFAPYWDRQFGMRHDSGEGPNRNWLAFGVEGLAPYRFDVEATLYIGESSRTALRFDASYEMLLTQKLILQPRLEANLYGKSDIARRLGSGMSDVAVGLRLRYEFRRELAPYLGFEWVDQYGQTKDLTQAAGGDPSDTRIVAGLRFWF